MSIDKPTLKKPVTKQSKNFEDETQRINMQHGIKENEENPHLNEVNVLLNEKEMSFKKKIFSLPKMEALVHSHPRLSEIYREMAADGEERYGYHYNETIMNIIFNDYILNDSELLQLYKKTPPKKKKRRDKSGIKKLQKELGSDEMKDKQANKEKSEEKPEKDKGVSEGGISIEGLPAKGQQPAVHGGKIVDTGAGDGLSSEDKKLKNTEVKSVDTVTKPPHKKVDNKTYKIGVEETTTTGGVGGGAFGSGGYATPHAWAGQGDLMGGSKKKEKKGKVLTKALREGDENYLIDSSTFEKYYDELNESVDSNINDFVNEFMRKHIREEAKSKAQQRFMGAVRGVQKGETKPSDVSPEIRKAARDMKSSDVRDFAGTKHDKLPEKVNEHHKHTPEDQAQFIADNVAVDSKFKDVNYTLNTYTPTQIKIIYDLLEKKMGLRETKINEHHIDTTDSYKLAEFIIVGTLYSQGNEMPDSGLLRLMVGDMQRRNSLGQLNRKYKMVERNLGEDGIAEVDAIISGLNETETSIITGSNQSMTFKPQPEGDLGSIPMGMQDTGGLRESEENNKDINKKHMKEEKDKDQTLDKKPDDKIDWERVKELDKKPLVKDKFTSPIDGSEMFEELNEELEAFSIHHKKLKTMTEDRKPMTLVLKDRLGKDNIANFKKDMKDSATKDVVKMEKDMAWKEQQQEVGDNPYKMGEDIEKEVLKNTKGDALKNVGNSANPKGDEVPKRNLTDDEQSEVDMYRLGQQDIVYDNKPDERFEERMKEQMGDAMYDQRQKKMEFRGKAPMYNKDSQPMHDTKSDKVQFNKEQSGWNEREGLGEGHVTGRFMDELGKRRLLDFELDEVNIILGDKLNENHFKLDFTGLGNVYDSKGNLNESINNTLNSHMFYTDGKVVVAVKNTKKSLNEGEQKKEKEVVNEQFGKMKHLLGYNPKDFINTKNNKL